MDTSAPANEQTPMTYLALGDSYTIGEAVHLSEAFPSQLVQLLRQQGWAVAAPEIVATTGWTTDELMAAIQAHHLLPRYDLVTLLIGVNNQYRGWPLANYKTDFAELLQQAIQFAGGNKDAVVVLSIPDWGATPFAKDRNREQIAQEIDLFNNAANEICDHQKIVFVDITVGSRAALNDSTLVAADGLHPSGREYKKWAEAVAQVYLESPLQEKYK
ncbi:SGNH/GDSL hydrolase family protein [Paracnuella aquatica]|nr:SGNH/GDSL hydrolase family protein [Paracnuella aquatica]